MITGLKKIFLFLLVCSTARVVALDALQPAEEEVSSPRRSLFRDGSWTLYLDNDIFNGTDRYYTNGFRFARLSEDQRSDDLPWFYQKLAGVLPSPFTSRETVKNVGFNIGQSMFTPADVDTDRVLSDDRPYAGWLYLGTSLQAKTRTQLDLLEISLGIVGPSALGREIQNLIHDTIGSSRSRGWKNQLRDEPTFNLYYQRKWRKKYLFSKSPSGWGTSIHSSLGASLGTVHTDLNAGAAIRLGFNLPDDFGSNRISPTAYVQPSLNRRDTEDRGFGWYAFAGWDGFARAHNIFLDGGFFKSGPSVDKKNFVGELEVGMAVTWREWRLGYTQVFRSDEFEEQDTGSQNFGTLALSHRF